MRFRVGSSVEVGVRQGSLIIMWRPAEVVLDKVGTCVVWYACDGVSPNPVVVSRKAIRPCPPYVSVSQNWKAGDVIEVFVDGTWYCAEVCQHSVGYYKVRIAGSSEVVEARSGALRPQQCWSNDRWMMNTEASKRCNESTRAHKKHLRSSHDHTGQQDHKGISRSRPDLMMRFPKKVEKLQPERIYAAESPSNFLDGPASLNPSVRQVGTGFDRSSVPVNVCSTSEREESSDDEGAASSVGSNFFPSMSRRRRCDGTSANKRRRRCYIAQPHETLEVKQEQDQVHRAEFESYASCLLAFYLSGPLSWEKQELLTNLRLELHISNDEHLQVLRNLEAGEVSNLAKKI